jgi:competence protein ComEC
MSGEVSLVAVAANVLVAPMVGPATVLGLAGGLVGLLVPFLGRVCGMLAGWCVGWVAVVAERGARMPQATIGWGTDAAALTVLVMLCVAIVVLAAKIAAHPRAALSLTAALALVVLDVPGRVGLAGGWPPDWVVVACDVGQGDAVAVATGPGAALVADAGPDPEAVDGCLRRLGVRHVPILSLSHFHADHVAGIRGVLRGRRVDAIEVPGLLDPPEGVELVREVAAEAGIPVRLAPYGETRTVGEVVVQVLWPRYEAPVDGPGDGSAANDGSIVMLVETRGIRVLLTGDVEPPSQLQLSGKLPAFEVDVLKVPHHGSRFQHLPWLLSLRPRVALFSAGEDNGYGHPNPDVLAAFATAGVVKGRTDTDGDVAVFLDAAGNLALRTRGR